MSNEDRLVELLERWEAAATGGPSVTPEDFCRDCPDLLGDFRKLLGKLGPVRAVLEGAGIGELAPDDFAPEGGRYRPLNFHARGGLGVVFLAEDEEVGRSVALKCMQRFASADPDARRSFLAEAELTGRLEHPGVVPVYGLGTDARGRPYYAMRFIRGETLGDAIKRYHGETPPASRNVELRRLLRHFVAVCETVAFAHSRGVIHRDLKPANVMVGEFGETLVVDWGLAKHLDKRAEARAAGSKPDVSCGLAETLDELGATFTGCAKGTPAFMPPEQAAGDWANVGPAADVYSLGATLFALLTGKHPFEGRTALEVIEKVKAGRLAPPRSVKTDVPKPLEAVCLKAMALRPADRYAGAKELAADVERWLADEPVAAWHEPFSLRARRWLRRHRTLVTGVGAAVLVSLCAAVALAVQQRESNRELTKANGDLAATNGLLERARQGLIKANLDLTGANAALTKANQREREAKTEAVEKGRLAEENRRLARRTLYPALMNLAGQSLVGQLDERALALLREAMPLPGDPDDFRRFEWYSAWQALTKARLGTVRFPGRVSELQMSADGSVLAGRCGTDVIIMGADGRQLKRMASDRFGGAFSLSRDGRRLAYQRGWSIELWRIGPDGKPEFERTIRAFDLALDGLTLTADGRRIIAAGDRGRLRAWDVGDGRLLYDIGQFAGDYATLHSLSVSPDGEWVAFVRLGKPVLVRLRPRRLIHPLPLAPFVAAHDLVAPIEPAGLPRDFSPNVTLTAAGSLCVWSEGKMWFWRLGDLAVRPDAAPGRTLDVSEKVWHIWEFPAPPGAAEAPVVYAATDRRPLVVRTPTVTRREFFEPAPKTRQLAPVVTTVPGVAGTFAVRPDGKVLAAPDHSGRVELLDAAGAADPALLLRHPDEGGVRDLRFLPDGRLLSLSGRAGFVIGRPGAAPELVLAPVDFNPANLTNTPSPTLAIALDGRWLAVRREKRVEIVSVGDPSFTYFLELKENPRLWGTSEIPLTLVPGQPVLVLAPETPTTQMNTLARPSNLAVWDFGRCQRATLGAALVGGSALLPRLNAIVLPRTVREVAVGASVAALDVSADGVWVAAACGDGAVRVYRGDRLTAPPRVLRAGASVRCVRFAPDGHSLAAGCHDGSVWLFPLAGDAEPVRIAAHTSPVTCLAFDRDGQTVVSGSEDGAVRFLIREQPQERFALHIGVPVTALALSHDGKELAVGGKDGLVRLYRAGVARDVLERARRRWAERPGERAAARDLLLALWGASLERAAAKDGPAARDLLREAREFGEKLPEELRREFASWQKAFAAGETK
jgi:WD40 repeat protein